MDESYRLPPQGVLQVLPELPEALSHQSLNGLGSLAHAPGDLRHTEASSRSQQDHFALTGVEPLQGRLYSRGPLRQGTAQEPSGERDVTGSVLQRFRSRTGRAR